MHAAVLRTHAHARSRVSPNSDHRRLLWNEAMQSGRQELQPRHLGQSPGARSGRWRQQQPQQLAVAAPFSSVLSVAFCALCLQDTAGEEKFDSLTNFYCRNATAALVCYDITN